MCSSFRLGGPKRQTKQQASAFATHVGFSTFPLVALWAALVLTVSPVNRAHENALVQAEWHKLDIRLPRGGFTYTIQDVPDSLAARFDVTRGLCLVSIRLQDEARLTVEGFGMPFANFEQPEIAGMGQQQ